eukprot:9772499-Lingulodinium_polyedra.AAC.1
MQHTPAYSIIQHNTAYHSIPQHTTVQCSITQHNTLNRYALAAAARRSSLIRPGCIATVPAKGRGVQRRPDFRFGSGAA